MRQEIYAFSEPNPRQDAANPGAVSPDMGNPIAAKEKHKHHCALWKFINIGHFHTTLDKAIPDQFKPVQQIGNQHQTFGIYLQHHSDVKPRRINQVLPSVSILTLTTRINMDQSHQ